MRLLPDWCVYLKDQKAFLSTSINNLRKHIDNNYKKMIEDEYNRPISGFYSIPDTIDLKPYITDEKKQSVPFHGIYLDTDTSFNTYWHKKTEVLVDSTDPDESSDVWAVFKFDKLGQFVDWFPVTPPKEEGWKHGPGPVVRDDGRVYMMHYHDTAGIRIVEYIYQED